jgi:hypothetical protein
MNISKSAKTEIKLFINSHKLSQFLSQHRILPYLLANILFKFYSKGSEFTKFGYENDKIFIYVEKFLKIEALFVQSLNK